MTTLLQFSIVYSLMLFSFSLILTLQKFVLMKTFYIFVFRRHLQDVLNKTNIFTLVIPLQKTSSRRWYTTWRRLEGIFETFSRRFAENVFKTSSRRLEDVLKTSERHLHDVLERRLQDVLEKCLQDIFKTFSRHIINLVLSTFLRRTAKTIICWKICLGHTSEKFTVSLENVQEWTLWI